MELGSDLLASREWKRVRARKAIENLLQETVNASKTLTAVSRSLDRWGFGVKSIEGRLVTWSPKVTSFRKNCEYGASVRQDAKAGQKKTGQISLSQQTVLPDGLATLIDGLKNKLNGPQSHLPADEKTQIPSGVDIDDGEGQPVDIEYRFEL